MRWSCGDRARRPAGSPARRVTTGTASLAGSGRVVAAYVVLCIVWGSTYLAIRIGVAELPPALFAGVRFLIAGSLLLGIATILGRSLAMRPRDVVTNVTVGFLLLFCGNGLVVWAEQFTPSGVTAIFVVTVTLWLTLFDAIIPGSPARATVQQVLALLAGFGGTLLLVGENLRSLAHADWRGPVALTGASAAWALGSVLSTRRPSEAGPEVNSALQMLTGGVALLLLGTTLGEWHGVVVSARGVGALAYLVVFGSLVGYSSYMYVLRHMAPTVAGTYSYVNTVVAVLLGWVVLNEAIDGRTLMAMVIVLASVAWVRHAARRRAAARA
jgi:drug/metabolite transporter (DMT)-like permease